MEVGLSQIPSHSLWYVDCVDACVLEPLMWLMQVYGIHTHNYFATMMHNDTTMLKTNQFGGNSLQLFAVWPPYSASL